MHHQSVNWSNEKDAGMILNKRREHQLIRKKSQMYLQEQAISITHVIPTMC